jgi:hypothetical protein
MNLETADKLIYPKTCTEGTYQHKDWISPTKRYSLTQNTFGQWWPKLKVLAGNNQWCDINIRDSNPFKTFSGACRFIAKQLDHDRNQKSP